MHARTHAQARTHARTQVSGMSGESEAKIRDLFAAAKAAAPCLVTLRAVSCCLACRKPVRDASHARRAR
jgi:hypothetical protein